jgi:hypothetical protein
MLYGVDIYMDCSTPRKKLFPTACTQI